jgi:NAD(P)-dependent dehydrogenase (short-subunit alcohol dehydrogenase family)
MTVDPDPAALFDLHGKVVVVTGGSRGLGRAMVAALSRAGAEVVVASRKFDACVEVATSVAAETGGRVVPKALHVGRWDEIEPFVAEVYAELGRVDVLVNNAGMSPLYEDLVSVSEKMFDAVVGVNMKGPFRLSALVGTRMVADGGGSIINISSVGSMHPDASIVPYAGAKAALNAMTVGLAHALGPSVRVNCIMPGAFLTDVTDHWDWEAMGAAFERFALQRVGRPEEIVGSVIYLASAASSFTTGAVFPVDGGHP